MLSKNYTSRNVLVIFFGIFVLGLLLWLFFGELNIFNYQWIASEDTRTGTCVSSLDGKPTTTIVSCSAGTFSVLYDASSIDWRLIVISISLFLWSLILLAFTNWLKITNYQAWPFAVAVSILVILTILTGAIPKANSSLIIFARLVIILFGTAICFVITNLISNSLILKTKNSKQILEQYKNELEQNKKLKQERKAYKEKVKSNEDSFVEDIKN